ncbi:helix-turn-helix domain-containing protein [Undibacterium danionis]|jgi:transcriptional regulator with XRE-family HTH domain|uniref:Helix-turn-helix domain-containing protein n=1 Tax=Undibacterium danionis TaxID=1812100 RepID=A0ABV6IJ52_9BURK
MPLPSFDQANKLSVQAVQKLISDRVRLERRRLGLTQVVFAAQCGIPLRTYKRLELGECDSLAALIRVSQFLGRAPGFSSLFPELLPPPLGRLDIALQSIRAKLDARAAKEGG